MRRTSRSASPYTRVTRAPLLPRSRFAESLPSLGFAAFASKDGYEQMQRFAKYTGRGLPLFLLDTSDRSLGGAPAKSDALSTAEAVDGAALSPPPSDYAPIASLKASDVKWLGDATPEEAAWIRKVASALARAASKPHDVSTAARRASTPASSAVALIVAACG